MTKFRFFLFEATESLRRSIGMTTLTVTTIAISLILVGAFYLSMSNVDALITKFRDDFQIIVFIKESVDTKTLALEMEQIKKWPQIASAKYISPENAKEILLSGLKDQELIKGLNETRDLKLPGAIKLMLTDIKHAGEVASRFKNLTYVEDVAYGQGMVSNIRSIVKIYNIFSTICIILLSIACLFIISNTIKLNILHRNEEIEIMKLVGATPWFIRWPFLIEGLIQGCIGAVIALVIISIIYPLVTSQLATLAPFIPSISNGFFLVKSALKLILFGAVLGSLGSLFSLRNLKTV